MPFISWPDIEALYLVRRSLKHLSELEPPYTPQPIPTVQYRGKSKLDGTNSAIRIENGTVTAQSRTQDITTKNDNCGFAAWVLSTGDFWQAVSYDVGSSMHAVTIFGEWCGQGIQKGTSVSTIPMKMFVCFAIQIGDSVVTEPSQIKHILSVGEKPENVFVLPWMSSDILTIDFADQVALEAVADTMNKMVLDVEACDPWVKDTFGVSGVGEGIVFYPVPDAVTGSTPRSTLSRLMFKAKGEKHRVKAAKVAVEVDATLLANTEQFVATFVTEPRLQQGLTVACGGDASPQNTGKFLKWVSEDCLKEGQADLAESGIEWKQVAGAVQNAARKWFLTQVGK